MHATSKARISLGNPRAYKGFRLVDPLALIPLCWTVAYGRPIGFRWLHLHLILEDKPTQAKWLEISRDTYPWAKDDEPMLKDSFFLFDITKRWYHNKSWFGLAIVMMFWYVLAIIDPNGKSLNHHNHQPSRNTSPVRFHHLGDVALIQLHRGIVEVSIVGLYIYIYMDAPNCLPHFAIFIFIEKFLLAMPPTKKKNKCLYNAFTSFFQVPPSQKKQQQMPIYTSKRACLLLIFLEVEWQDFAQKFQENHPPLFSGWPLPPSDHVGTVPVINWWLPTDFNIRGWAAATSENTGSTK